MRSFVRCPSCERRLLINAERESGRKRCPRCLSRFALGSRINPDSPGPAEFLAFELFDEEGDDEIEVLDDEEPETIKPAPAVFGPHQDHPIPDELPKKQRRSDRDQDYDDMYDERDYLAAGGKYVYHPEDAPGWNLTKWGITLILVAIIMRFGAMAFSFFAFTVAAATSLSGEGSLMPLSNLVGLGADALTLVGTCLCINVPRQTGARSWVIMSLALSVASLAPALFLLPLTLGMDLELVQVMLHNPWVLVLLVGIGLMVAFGSFMSFLMFLERVAEVFNERGIGDSVNATLKLAGTLAGSICVGLIAIGILLTRNTDGRLMSGNDPSLLVIGVCAGAFQAWIGILGLIVFVKYVLNLLNIRALIDWASD